MSKTTVIGQSEGSVGLFTTEPFKERKEPQVILICYFTGHWLPHIVTKLFEGLTSFHCFPLSLLPRVYPHPKGVGATSITLSAAVKVCHFIYRGFCRTLLGELDWGTV